jgi:hypothetical protein
MRRKKQMKAFKQYVIRCATFLSPVRIYAQSKEQAIASFRKQWSMDRMPPNYTIEEVKE